MEDYGGPSKKYKDLLDDQESCILERLWKKKKKKLNEYIYVVMHIHIYINN